MKTPVSPEAGVFVFLLSVGFPVAHLRAVAFLLTLAAAPALAAGCDFPAPPPPQSSEPALPVRPVNACGQTYEVGYRLEGNILYFPGGGRHAIGEVDEAQAERVLREAYGLVGPRSALVRTRF